MSWQTNVAVPLSALEALRSIRARCGYRSRAEAVRELLGEYVAVQSARAPDQRLVHVATLLRYPPPRREARFLGVDPGKQLRISCDKHVWDSARALAFALPGQCGYRGHGEYQARRGTDAVLAAIALAQPLDDPQLGEYQLLTRWQAEGLWRLVIACTRTPYERRVAKLAAYAADERSKAVRDGAPDTGEPTTAESVASGLAWSVAWHGRERFTMAGIIVRERLTGPEAAGFLRMLDERARHDEEWWLDRVAEYQKAYQHHPIVRKLHEMPVKGATAVWRAERSVRSGDMVRWLMETVRASAPTTYVMRPPGWVLRVPGDWTPTLFDAADAVPTQWLRHAEAGRVLHLRHGNKHVLWPTRVIEDCSTTQPVSGFDVVVKALTGREGWEIVETVLLNLNDKEAEDANGHLRVRVPAHIACDLGLIAEEHRDALIGAAGLQLLQDPDHTQPGWMRPEMNHDLLFADLDKRCRIIEEREQARMAYARGQQAFVRYLAAINHPWRSSLWFKWDGRENKATWWWPGQSLASAVDAGDLSAAAVRWLSIYLFELRRQHLNTDMGERWIESATHYVTEFDGVETDVEDVEEPVDYWWGSSSVPPIDDEAPF
jgi:hypothetical protein